MDALKKVVNARKNIAIRFLYTILLLIVFEMLKALVELIVIVQYVFILLTTHHHEGLRLFSNKVLHYAYQMMRYMTVNENQKPYPFGPFPQKIEPPESTVKYD